MRPTDLTLLCTKNWKCIQDVVNMFYQSPGPTKVRVHGIIANEGTAVFTCLVTEETIKALGRSRWACDARATPMDFQCEIHVVLQSCFNVAALTTPTNHFRGPGLCPNRVHWFWVKFPYVLPSNRYMPSKREGPWNLCPRFFCLRNTATRHPDIEESGTGGREPRGHAWHAKWHHLYKTSKTGAPHRAIGWAESPSRFMSFHLSPKNGFMLMDAKPIGNSPLNLQASAADPPLGSGTSKRSALQRKNTLPSCCTPMPGASGQDHQI